MRRVVLVLVLIVSLLACGDAVDVPASTALAAQAAVCPGIAAFGAWSARKLAPEPGMVSGIPGSIEGICLVGPAILGMMDRYNPNLNPGERTAILRAIVAAGLQWEVDPLLIASVIAVESGYNPQAFSRAKARGLMQITSWLNAWYEDPYDIGQNVNAGTRFLREQMDAFGRVELALAAYNAGPPRVARCGAVPDISETRTYVARVQKIYQQLRSGLKRIKGLIR